MATLFLAKEQWTIIERENSLGFPLGASLTVFVVTKETNMPSEILIPWVHTMMGLLNINGIREGSAFITLKEGYGFVTLSGKIAEALEPVT